MKVVSSFSLRTRLFAGFGVMCALLALLAVVGLRANNESAKSTEKVSNLLTVTHDTDQMKDDVDQLVGLETFGAWSSLLPPKVSAPNMKIFNQFSKVYSANLTKDLASFHKQYLGGDEAAQFAKASAAIKGFLAATGKQAEDLNSGDPQRIAAAGNNFGVIYQRYVPPATASAQKLVKSVAARAATARKHADDVRSSSRTLMLVITVLALLLGVGLAWLIVSSVVPVVRRFAGFASQVSEGDLTARVESKGRDEFAELGGHLNTMVENLAGMSGQVLSGAESISSSASEILATVNKQTAGANQQSAAITQTTTATEQIRASAELAAQKAQEVAEQAQQAVQVGDDGTHAVEAIVDGMSAIREKVEAIASDVQALSEQTAQIEAITNAVNDIADQSNLLALNATIEAARAGEQGKGFAVVADEVRNLAEQSKQATAQVQAILGDIDRATRAAVSGAQEGTEVVEQGTELAQRAGEIIAQLAQTNRVTSQAAAQIAASAQEQNSGMDQITRGMQDTSQATAELAAGAQESQATAEGLNQVATQLHELASRYRI
jgi:methyl-accepting chemotaxis protein